MYKEGRHVRFLFLTSTLLLFTLVFTPSSVSAAQRHDCASPIPHTVPGTLVQPPTTQGILVINEVLLRPGSIWNCSEYTMSTNDVWIEMYNPQNQPFDLYSVHSSIDAGPNTSQYYLPFGAAIAPHGFLVIFPRYRFFQATESQTLRLLIGSAVIDEVTIPPLGKDQSYARMPDGSPNWFITDTPTIDVSNTSPVVSPPSRKAKAEATATVRATQRASKSTHARTNGSGGNSFDSSSDTGTNSRQQQNNGVQPSWSSLKHPGELTTPPPATTQSGNNTPTVNSSASDVFHKILLTVLAIALMLSLFWCWHLFRPS